MGKQESYDDSMYLHVVLGVFWRKKWLIVFGVLGVTFASIIMIFTMAPNYKSRAVITLSSGNTEAALSRGLEIPVYNKYSNTLKSPTLLRKFVAFKKMKDDWYISVNYLNNNIKPLYGYDKQERVKSTENFIIGIRLSSDGDTPEMARDRCRLLGEFALTAILNLRIGDFIERLKISLESQTIENRQKINNKEYNITELKEKEQLILKLIKEIPELGKTNTRELLNVSEKTEKYLSPRQQLVAIRIEIKNSLLRIKRMKKAITSSEYLLDFLNQIADYIDNKKNFLVNENLLDNLINELEKFFAGRDEEGYQDAYYRLKVGLKTYLRMKNVIYKFVSGPTLPDNPTSLPKRFIIISTMLTALLFFLFIGICIEWWEKNKSSVIGSN